MTFVKRGDDQFFNIQCAASHCRLRVRMIQPTIVFPYRMCNYKAQISLRGKAYIVFDNEIIVLERNEYETLSDPLH